MITILINKLNNSKYYLVLNCYTFIIFKQIKSAKCNLIN
jgi:hypothetical protein